METWSSSFVLWPRSCYVITLSDLTYEDECEIRWQRVLAISKNSLPCPPQWLLIYYIWRQRTNLIIQHFKNGFSFLLHEISYLLPANPLIILWVVLFSLSMPAVFTLKITKSGQLESNRSQFKSRVVTRSSCMKFSILSLPFPAFPIMNEQYALC